MEARSNHDADGEERLRSALERLTNIQKSILELNQEANQIRRHIRDFDVNIEALSILATVRTKDQKSDGVRLLSDISEYARQTGIHLDALPMSDSSTEPPPSRAQSDSHLRVRTETTAQRPKWKTVSQLVVAALVTVGLFVLVH